MLLGAYTAWLSAPGRGEALRAAVPLLLGSLAVCEEGEPAGWPLRSKQEHAGVVALTPTHTLTHTHTHTLTLTLTLTLTNPNKQEHAGVVALHKLATSVRVRVTEPEP